MIFESDTPAGKSFDVTLLLLICASVVVVALESVQGFARDYGALLSTLEWTLTAAFTLEYIARLACVERPLRYARSFFGVVDLAAVLPMYLATFVPGLHVLIDIRVLRMLRAFRILKLTEYLREYRSLTTALHASRRKVLVFVSAVAMVVVVLGTIMYVVEGPANGFTSIPVSIYWAITTMTTVGFGDITPSTNLGRAIASLVMLLGWGILAVPTGIVTAEMTTQRLAADAASGYCPSCGSRGHIPGSAFCHRCGTRLDSADGVPPGDKS